MIKYFKSILVTIFLLSIISCSSDEEIPLVNYYGTWKLVSLDAMNTVALNINASSSVSTRIDPDQGGCLPEMNLTITIDQKAHLNSTSSTNVVIQSLDDLSIRFENQIICVNEESLDSYIWSEGYDSFLNSDGERMKYSDPVNNVRLLKENGEIYAYGHIDSYAPLRLRLEVFEPNTYEIESGVKILKVHPSIVYYFEKK